MNRILLAVVLLLAAIGVLSGRHRSLAETDSRTLWVHYSLEKNQYLVTEPIFLSLSLENYGTDSQHFASLLDFWRKDCMELIDETGAQVRFRGKEVEFGYFREEGDTGTIGLRPGPHSRTRDCTMNLLDYFGRGEGPFDFYLVPGHYTLRAIGLKSDTISFAVVEPSSPEDSAAAAQLMFIADNRYSVARGYAKEFRIYSQFVTQFPNSILTPVALNALLDLSTDLPAEQAVATNQRYVRMMLTKFPESGFAYYALQRLDERAVPIDEKSALLNGLRKLRPRLKSADLLQKADELIAKLEK